MATIGLKIKKGIDNIHDPITLGRITDWRDKNVNILVQAENIDLDDLGRARRRKGRTRALAISSPHSSWTNPFKQQDCYFVAANVLYQFNTDATATAVQTLSNNLPCGYETINGEAIVSNGTDIGWLSGSAYTAFVGSTDPGGFYATMVPGRFLAFWNSTLWAANGNLLQFSVANNAQTRDTRYDTIPMDGGLRMLAAVEDGLWLATDKHVSFVQGSGPDDLRFRHVSDAVPPHGCFSVGFTGDEKQSSRIVYWASPDGFCTGRAGGVYTNLSDNQVRLPSGSQGFCVKKENNGFEQYIAVIRDAEDSNIYTADSLVINTYNI